MSSTQNREAICGQEALNLLNCVADLHNDVDKCSHLLQSLRQCIIDKKVKKFSLAEEENHGKSDPSKTPK